tara:strand:- start:7420 stop:8178 length:759 start_codon:yes stop_codon:yes gene_type:complete
MFQIKKLLLLFLAASLLALPTHAQTSPNKANSNASPTPPNDIDLPVGEPRSPEEMADVIDPEEDDPPKLYDEDLPTEELSIIYVIDVSGSMWHSCPPYTGLDGTSTTGNRLDRAKVEVIRSISALTENYTFNIISYHCALTQWRPQRAKAVEPNKSDAYGWVMLLRPGGGTGTGPAAALALSDKENYTVALLSDGWPGCGIPGAMSGHLQMILLSNTQGAQVHTFGINTYGAAEQFLRDIATNTGGVYYPVN